MASEPITTAYIIKPSYPSVYMYEYIPVSLLGNGWVKVTTAIKTYATIEELLDALFSMRSVWYQGN
jgi:hypothetical protein